ncbi:MAG: 50S ribosomal protein L11 methyltransferase [Actinomycetota bacterium]
MHHLVTVARPADDPTAELLVDDLWAAGAVGVEEIGSSIRAAFVDDGLARKAAKRHQGRVETVDDRTGLDAWRSHAGDYRAGPFHVRPPWIDGQVPADAIELVIDPGHAFGSGSHPTTRLMLAALAEHVRAGDRVVDLGTGSGVLAVAAARLGAEVLGIDIDPAAATAVAENAAANGVADLVRVLIADIAAIDPTPADVVLLNVTIDIHEAIADAVRRIDPTILIVAGVLDGAQAERVATLYGRVATATATDDGWAVLVFDRGRDDGPS